MSTGGMNARYRHRPAIKWRDVPGIYKARFRKLGHVVRLSLLATMFALGTVVLAPVMFGIAFFSGHLILTILVVSAALAFSGWLFWKSFKLAFDTRG